MWARGTLGLALVALASMAGCTGDSSLAPTSLSEGFEQGLDAWTSRSELTGGAARGGWAIDTTTSLSTEGSAALNLTLDARERDGGIWIDRTVEVDAGVPYELSVSLDAWSPRTGERPHARLLVRVGPQPPGGLAGFPEDGGQTGQPTWGIRAALDQQPGWRSYAASGSIPSFEGASVTVSVGVEAVEAARLHYAVDDLDVVLVPEPIGGGTGTSPV